jgi:hypothetical protein
MHELKAIERKLWAREARARLIAITASWRT